MSGQEDEACHLHSLDIVMRVLWRFEGVVEKAMKVSRMMIQLEMLAVVMDTGYQRCAWRHCGR